jgi:hypothetical protein
MRIAFALIFSLVCASVHAECVGGRCSTRCSKGRCGTTQPVRTVVKEVVPVIGNTVRGTVHVVAPPYRGRCANGKCNLR